MGRKAAGPKMVTNMDGSEQARRRLRVILETVSGQRTIAQACAELGIAEARFHELRDEALKGALGALEPARAGRPPKTTVEEKTEIAALKAENTELRIELQAARVREEIAAVMPHVLLPRKGDVKKTSQELFGRKRGTSNG